MSPAAARVKKKLRKISVGVVGVLVAAVVAGVAYEQWSRWNAWRVYPPPGQLIEIDGARSHLHCIGEGSPIVVLEAGLDLGSWNWRMVHREIAATTRVCSYDRAGLLWSEPRPGPRDAHGIADELHALLTQAGESPPYVMVGHSLGGLLVRVFAHRFEGEVVGFVLVDSSHPEQQDRFPVELRAPPPWSPPLFVTKMLAATGVLRLIWDDGADSPDSLLPVFGPSSYPAAEAEWEALPAMLVQAGSTGGLGDRPLVVLTAGHREPISEMSEETLAIHELIRAMQVELAALSTNVDHRVCPRAGHFIQLDDPRAVVMAVQDVVLAVREGSPVRKAPKEPSDVAGD